jgi:hypothetical protein
MSADVSATRLPDALLTSKPSLVTGLLTPISVAEARERGWNQWSLIG